MLGTVRKQAYRAFVKLHPYPEAHDPRLCHPDYEEWGEKWQVFKKAWDLQQKKIDNIMIDPPTHYLDPLIRNTLEIVVKQQEEIIADKVAQIKELKKVKQSTTPMDKIIDSYLEFDNALKEIAGDKIVKMIVTSSTYDRLKDFTPNHYTFKPNYIFKEKPLKKVLRLFGTVIEKE